MLNADGMYPAGGPPFSVLCSFFRGWATSPVGKCRANKKTGCPTSRVFREVGRRTADAGVDLFLRGRRFGFSSLTDFAMPSRTLTILKQALATVYIPSLPLLA